jgi:hypothetical protein
MLEPLIYGAALAIFGFVIFATARVPQGMLLVGCIPAVFVALVMGFVMMIYAWDTYGAGLPAAAMILAVAAGWYVPRRYKPRDQIIVIYLAWAIGLVCTLIAVQMPDVE